MLTPTIKTVSDRPCYSVTVRGITAALIDRANRASFYGIHGNKIDCVTALRAACEAVRDYMVESDSAWNSIYILDAHAIDTAGTKTPYAAEIRFTYD